MGNILKTIKSVLIENGIDAYFPSQHKGECIAPYTVIKSSGTLNLLSARTVSSERPIYEFLLYVPKNNYSYLEEYKIQVRTILKKLFPLIQYAGMETPSFYDDEVKGHMISFQYYGVRKINNR